MDAKLSEAQRAQRDYYMAVVLFACYVMFRAKNVEPRPLGPVPEEICRDQETMGEEDAPKRPSNASSFKEDVIIDMPKVSPPASNSAPATLLVCRDGLSQSSIKTQNVAAATSEIHVSASEASNGANAGSQTNDDNSASEDSKEANAGSGIHNHENDYSAPTVTPDVNARETKFKIKRDIVIVGITGQGVFNLAASPSTDSPYLRWCAATAGVGFFGSFFAICVMRNQKLAKILSKIGAIGATSAVCIGLGITVLKDTEWYLNVVATVSACVLTTVVIVKAN